MTSYYQQFSVACQEQEPRDARTKLNKQRFVSLEFRAPETHFLLDRSQLISAAVESFGRITTAKTDNPYCTLDKQKWSGTINTSDPYNTLKLKEGESNVDAVVCVEYQFFCL